MHTRGFTFLETIIAAGIVVVVAALGILFLNPAQQLAKARNTRRSADVNSIANAIGQNIADHRGFFSCAAGTVPASSTRMKTGSGNYDAAPCLVATYLATMPYDPSAAGAFYTSTTSYDTAYAISKNATTGRITVSAIYPELGETFSATR